MGVCHLDRKRILVEEDDPEKRGLKDAAVPGLARVDLLGEIRYNGSNADEDMFRDAVRVVIESRKASTSLLQRRLRIGYGRAARLMEEMEEQGIIGAADGSRPRDVLVSSLDQVFGGGGASNDDSGADLDEYGVPVEPNDRDEYLAR